MVPLDPGDRTVIWGDGGGQEVRTMSYTKNRTRGVTGTKMVATVMGEHKEVRYDGSISTPSVNPDLSPVKTVSKNHLLFLHFNAPDR